MIQQLGPWNLKLHIKINTSFKRVYFAIIPSCQKWTGRRNDNANKENEIFTMFTLPLKIHVSILQTTSNKFTLNCVRRV